jgi:hypothetical protein
LLLVLQNREGNTCSINAYDDQIVTWGTGFGGAGKLNDLMRFLVKDPNSLVIKRLHDAGVQWAGDSHWQVVDPVKKRVIDGKVADGKDKGKDLGLLTVRRNRQLLLLLIDLARDPATRQIVLDAQLHVFMTTSAAWLYNEMVTSIAAFTFVTHLKHWAPAYCTKPVLLATIFEPDEGGTLTTSTPKSVALDAKIVLAAVHTFYRHATLSHGWFPDFTQAQGYWQDMKADGAAEKDDNGQPVNFTVGPSFMDNPPLSSKDALPAGHALLGAGAFLLSDCTKFFDGGPKADFGLE